MNELPSTVIAVSGLMLLTKIWMDISEIWKHQIKMKTYLRMSQCALEVFKLAHKESTQRRRKR